MNNFSFKEIKVSNQVHSLVQDKILNELMYILPLDLLLRKSC